MTEELKKSLAGDFIARRDFMPLKDEEGSIVTGGTVTVLLKQSFGSVVILELIDAESLTSEEIAARLADNAKRLDSMQVSQCYLFETFFFTGEPDPEKLKLIEEGQMQKTMAKKYLKCLTVNLGAGTIQKHFKVPVTDYSIVKTISERLSGKAPEASIDNIEDIVRGREAERKLEYRAKTPFVTYGLIAVNIIVFGILYYLTQRTGNTYDEALSYYGAKVNSGILDGQYWRFVSPIFLHANLIHLAINCYSLYVVGVLVEKVFGHVRFTFIYLFAGVLGNLFSFMFSINNGVGASGAIFGLLGALLYFGLERPALFKAYFGYGVISTIVINLAYGFSNSGIDNYAHLGGLLGGFLACGVINTSSMKKWYLNRILYAVLVVAISAGGLYYGFNNGNNLALASARQFDSLMSESKFSDAEKLAEKVLAARPSNKGFESEYLRGALMAEAQSNKLDEALKHAQELTSEDPAEGHYFTGIIYYYMNRYEDSKKEILKAKELKVRYTDVDDLLKALDELIAKK